MRPSRKLALAATTIIGAAALAAVPLAAHADEMVRGKVTMVNNTAATMVEMCAGKDGGGDPAGDPPGPCSGFHWIDETADVEYEIGRNDKLAIKFAQQGAGTAWAYRDGPQPNLLHTEFVVTGALWQMTLNCRALSWDRPW